MKLLKLIIGVSGVSTVRLLDSWSVEIKTNQTPSFNSVVDKNVLKLA